MGTNIIRSRKRHRPANDELYPHICCGVVLRRHHDDDTDSLYPQDLRHAVVIFSRAVLCFSDSSG
jgi:hypothetical protein